MQGTNDSLKKQDFASATSHFAEFTAKIQCSKQKVILDEDANLVRFLEGYMHNAFETQAMNSPELGQIRVQEHPLQSGF
jgi:hypothetical protein